MGRTASARITIARIATILWKEGLVRVFVFMILLRIFVQAGGFQQKWIQENGFYLFALLLRLIR
jgi:hypothetical protein